MVKGKGQREREREREKLQGVLNVQLELLAGLEEKEKKVAIVPGVAKRDDTSGFCAYVPLIVPCFSSQGRRPQGMNLALW